MTYRHINSGKELSTAVMMTLAAQAAKTAKVVVEDGGATLRFVFDAVNYGEKDSQWFSVASWFYDFTKLTSVEGVRYWDTSKAKNFYALFARCSGLTTLDIAGLSTAGEHLANRRRISKPSACLFAV